MTTNNQQVDNMPVDILVDSIIGKNELTDVQCIKLVNYIKAQLTIKDEQHVRELELARIDAQIEEVKGIPLHWETCFDNIERKHYQKIPRDYVSDRLSELTKIKKGVIK